MTGLGAALMTEESLSKLLSDIKLPRDAKNYVINQAQKRKSELASIVAQEFKGFLEHINIRDELRKALSGMTIDVSATIHFDRRGTTLRVTRAETTRPSKKATKRTPKRR